MACVFCKLNALYGIELSDGNIIHKDCYEKNMRRFDDLKSQLRFAEQELIKYEKKKSGISGFFRLLFGNELNYTIKLAMLDGEVEKLKNEINPISNMITYVHDYMLDYPPDWAERCNQLKKLSFSKCQKCGITIGLQAHHVVPLSRGGSNKINNLKLLCRTCHLKEHNKEDFLSEYSGKLSIQDKVDIINKAIDRGSKIEFFYKKKTDQFSIKRIVKPYKFTKAFHKINVGEFTLCITGFCYIRNADRTFALKRMTQLKILGPS